MTQATTVLLAVLIKVPSIDKMYNYVAIFHNVLMSLKCVHNS